MGTFRLPKEWSRPAALAAIGLALLAASPHPAAASAVAWVLVVWPTALAISAVLAVRAHLAPGLVGPVLVLCALNSLLLLRLDPPLAARAAVAWCVGLLAFAVLSELDPEAWWPRAGAAAGAGVALMFAAAGLGRAAGGARAWLDFGGLTLQPSELFKPIWIVYLSGLFAAPGALGVRRNGLIAVAAGAAAALLWQRDLGAILVLAALWLALAYAAGRRAGALALGAAGLAVAAAAGWLAFAHVGVRFTAWLHPFADPDGAGFQTLRGLFALRGGRLLGTGWGRDQSDTLVAGPTDYALAAVAEQLGWIGVLAVLATMVALFLRIARIAQDHVGARRLVALGIGVWLLGEALLVSGGIARVWPLTGVTFPFLSYGGSSLVACWCGLGLVNRIAWEGQSG
ncbi:MAG TPA: FtsW/RodA/SpoVE family cell cycle protein [Limnochordia bacterium]|nr:FtsW/RodA/SpoVE family cell cycle protein [Limnochordia bacterium]